MSDSLVVYVEISIVLLKNRKGSINFYMDGNATSVSQFNNLTTLSSSLNSNRSMKYGGLVHRSAYKQFKDKLEELVDYVYTIAPSFSILHTIIGIFRVLQFVGPALCPSSKYWSEDHVLDITASVLSIFFHILPPEVRNEGIIVYCYIYIIVMVIFIALIVGSAYYFAKTAKLPEFITISIAIFFATANFVMHPIALTFVFEMIAKIIFKGFYNISIVFTIVIALIVLVLFVFYLWLYLTIVGRSLVFRPTSLMAVMTLPQDMIYIATMVVNCIFGFAAHCTKYYQLGFLVVTTIIYIASAFIPYIYGGFVRPIENSIVTGTSLTGAVISIMFLVSISLDQSMTFTLLIIIFAVAVVLVIIVVMINRKLFVRSLMILDHIQEVEEISNIRNVNSFIEIAINGIIGVHPLCISWKVFRMATERWPSQPAVWFLFAKFSSLYPEDIQTVAWIFHTICASKLKGAIAKTIKLQTLSVTRAREANLSPNLKVKLNGIQKRLQQAKHKLRHVWDLAIQGNIGEMESGVKRAYQEIEKNDAEFKHLFREFPNNRFVTRSYARFCKEILANQTEYMEFMEKSRLLQRGIMVNKDLTHELGLKAFPTLPTRVNVIQDNQNLSTEMSMSSIEENDEENAIDDQQISDLRDKIDELSIPAIRGTRFIRFFMILILFIVPTVALFIYSSVFVADLTSPLGYFKSIANLGEYVSFVTVFLNHYVYENLGEFNNITKQTNPPTLLGGKYDSKAILQYVLAECTTSLQDSTDFNSYISTNENILRAQDLMFDSIINYTYFKNEVDHEDKYQTIQTGILQIISEAQDVLRYSTIPPSIVNTSSLLNPIVNMNEMTKVVEEVETLFIEFITDNFEETSMIWQIVMIVTVILEVLLYLGAMIFQVIWIQRNKEEVYKCLTALPKNVVSSLVENLRVLKNDGNETSTANDTEVNKQEDNILKTFVTGGAADTKIADRIIIIIGSFITVILEMVILILFCQLITYENQRLLIAAPHLNYLTSALSGQMVALLWLQTLALRYSHSTNIIHQFSTGELEEMFLKQLTASRNSYHAARFGGPSLEEAPFQAFQEGLDLAYSLIVCVDPEAIPWSFMEMITCYNVEGLYILSEALMQRMYFKQKGNNSFVLTPKFDFFDYTMTILISPIFEGLFGPMYGTIIPTIQKELKGKLNSDFIIIAVLMIIGILCEIPVYISIMLIEHHIKATLRLLLHAPASVLFSTFKIATILSGDFSRAKGDNTKRNAEFYDNLYQNMTDAVMIVDTVTRQIEMVNKSCIRLFFESAEELLGKEIKDFLSQKKFSGDIHTILKHQSSMESDPVHITEQDPEGGIVNLEMKSVNINGKQAIIVRDITNILRYNKLIQDERAKSDTLLASILPPSLVKRVQAGEKNISFAVQIATIVFMDIVSFTPWCGSTEANKVMMTLNLLFKKFDSALATYPAMTKIKCIGDCYMAAGGIFSDVSQPAEQAKEVVSFGLDALECVKELDEELNEKLQIRVGINTGGPIVAGVLGIGKPTFEILGPAINMAQQMEHHGVPSNVHISRPVYELIYGDTFKIKERGSIEVKNGSVVTYLVTGKRA